MKTARWMIPLAIVVAIGLTLASAAYQRRTGPTWPLPLEAEVWGATISGSLLRSGTTGTPAPVELTVEGPQPELVLLQKRYKVDEPWQPTPFAPGAKPNTVVATLRDLPPAGKMEYAIAARKDGDERMLTPKTVILRYKGEVALQWLVPHIILMFSGMLLSNLTGILFAVRRASSLKLPLATFSVFAVGGLIFGAMVQKQAFGHYWTGLPFGTDVTDNKVLIVLVVWLIALWRYSVTRKRGWVVAAAMVLFGAFLVPHSVGGSELDFNTGKHTNTF